MSLRKQAIILGITPSYLSMLVNGKRKWPDALSHRYDELVNTPNQSVNKQGSSGFLPAKLKEVVVGQPGFEPGTSVLSSSILAEYLDELALKGRSSTYISHVRRCLDKYVQQYTELTHVSARAFLRQYSHLSASTRASYTIYVRGLFKHFGLPFDLSVRIPRRLPPHVASSDIERLAYSISHKATHKQSSVRDMVLLETAINTGLRRSELANLRVRDIDFDSQRLKVVNGK